MNGPQLGGLSLTVFNQFRSQLRVVGIEVESAPNARLVLSRARAAGRSN